MSDIYATGSFGTASAQFRAHLNYSVSSSSTTTTVTWKLYLQGRHNYGYPFTAALSGAASKSLSGSLSSNPGSTWTTIKSASGTTSFARGTSAATKTFTIKATGPKAGSYSGTQTVTKTASVSVPALASYTVSYNANGGSGAPASQTKYYGKSLTLSSTKPTRTGYTFLGWSTSSTATSATYAAEESYTANSGATLYAVWRAITYQITYNANGGTGAPTPQTKNYNVPLSLSIGQISRQYYRFLGWALTNNAEVPTYKKEDIEAGTVKYETNAAAVLYAVWADNSYTIKYDTNGKTLDSGYNFPDDTQFDLAVSPTYSLYSIQATADTGAEFLNSFQDNDGNTYSLGGTYYPIAKEEVTFIAQWVNNYVDPNLGTPTIYRVDKYGNKSIGGENYYINLPLIPAKHVNQSGSQSSLEYASTSATIDWVPNDIPSYTNNNMEELENYIIDTFNNEEQAIYKTATQCTITLVDNNPPPGETGYFSLPISLPIQNQEDSEKEFEILSGTFNAARRKLSSRIVDFSFNWETYYDGNEYYENSIEFIIKATPYTIIDGIEVYDDANAQQSSFTASGRSGTFQGFFRGISVDKNLKVQIISVIATNDNETSHTWTPSSLIATANTGGYPVHISQGGEGISLFGVATDGLDAFEVNKKTILNNDVSISNNLDIKGSINNQTSGIVTLGNVYGGPGLAGIIQMFAGSTAPIGWLICDGSAVSRETYSILYSIIGDTYGAGDGSTTFNLPDLRGRVPVGIGTGTASDATAHTLGQTEGTETHTLTTAQMPSHTHYNIIDATDKTSWDGRIKYITAKSLLSDSTYKYRSASASGNYYVRSAVTDSSGSSTAHPNMQPYLGINFIICTGIISQI